MKKRTGFPTRHLIIAGCALALSSLTQPAHAYYFGNWSNWAYLPYTLGNGLAYPLRSVLRLPYMMGNPYYMTQYAVQSATRGAYMRAPGYGPSPLMQQDPYTDPEPINDPRQRQRPYKVGQPNQIASYANWQKDPNAVANDVEPVIDPTTGNLIPPAPPPFAPQRGPAGAPANAGLPQGGVNSGALSAGAIAPTTASQGPAPLAAGFVRNVNEKFDGDISKALFDSDTRSWARMIGLADNNDIFNAELSNDRIEVVRKIFRDPHLDALSKIDAAKILLRSPSAPKVSNK